VIEKRIRQFDAETRSVIDSLQMATAQHTGEVPAFPFVTGPDGTLHELVEYDVREPSGKIERKIGEIVRKLGDKNE